MLELATTEEIVEELGRRCSTVVVIIDKSIDKNTDESLVYYKGNLNSAIGLCFRGRKWLTDDLEMM